MTAHLVVGVVGHVDHGKTALVRALTGIDTDRLPEEKRRGISIALGFAHLAVPGATIDLIDMPGHERFVRTLVSGATGIAAVLLVVAANEGIKPQTLEHMDIAALLGLRRAAIAVTKADLVTPDRLAEVCATAAALCRTHGMAAGTPVAVSAQTGSGIDTLRTALAALLQAATPPRDTGMPFLPIDRTFSVPGHGTVVTGTLRGGPLAAGDELAVTPNALPVRIRGLQVRGTRATTAQPGQRVAVNLRGVEATAVPPGAALSAPGLLSGTTWLSLLLRATATAPPLPTTARLRLLVGTQDVAARLRLLDRDVLEPGATALAQVQCAESVAVPAHEHAILRIASPAATVAGGRILDTGATRLRRHDPAILARLTTLAAAAPEDLVWLETKAAGSAGTTLARLGALAGLGPAVVARILAAHPVVTLRSGTVVALAALDAVATRVLPLLDAAGPDAATPLGRLRATLPSVGDAVLDEALARLATAGLLRQEAGAVRLLRRNQEARRTADATALEARLAAALLRGGLTPPDPAVLAPDVPSRRALAQLVRSGLVVRTTDRVKKRDVLFHRDAVAAARQQLAPLLGGTGLKVTEAGATLGISRKFSVPLLEYLDSVQFTRRVDDRRVLGPGAAR